MVNFHYMCGRFALTSLDKEIIEEFDVAPFPYSPSYNIAPTHTIFVMKEERKVTQMRWGLIPSWTKDEKVSFANINARAESLEEKPAYAKPFLTQRCLILASGFFEWKKSTKTPYYIHSDKLISFGGVYDIWEHNGKRIVSCAIITTAANKFMKPLHDRMPLIITKQNRIEWLANTKIAKQMLVPYGGELEAYEVSTLV